MLRKKMKKYCVLFVVVVQLVMLAGQSVMAAEVEQRPSINYEIINPYETVDWTSFGQYKADFHSHTHESDGANSPKEMIEDHYAKGFDVYAITDHNFVNTTWDRTDRPADIEYLTSERLAEITNGTDRNGRGMTAVPYANEQSKSNHVNSFFADFNNEGGATLEGNIAKTEELGGISHINHPGRYTGGSGKIGEDGRIASSKPETVQKYVDLFTKYSSCVGMEIINKKDGDSASDRILWDNILTKTMPERPVWGFSNDDTHHVNNTGFSYNMMLMPENTLENVRTSMETGTFYAVALVSKRELGVNFVAQGPSPKITNINVDQIEDSITIEGENYHTIEWIADGQIIATGNVLDLNDYEAMIGTYVRAQLKGDGGISFTQPFGVKSDRPLNRLKSVTISADKTSITDTLNGMDNTLQISLTPKDDSDNAFDLSSAIVTYKSDNEEVVKVTTSGSLTIVKKVGYTKNIKVWAEVQAGGRQVFSNVVTVEVVASADENGFKHIAIPVKSGIDDVEELMENGNMYTTSSDLEIGYEKPTKDNKKQQIIGIRFTDITVPKGAIVKEAYIQFTVDEPNKSADPFEMKIYAEDTVNAESFKEVPYNVSSRTKSSQFVEWKNIPIWEVTHAATEKQRTTNLKELVQERIDESGWKQGNAMAFIIEGIGNRTAESFEGGQEEKAPCLHIIYSDEHVVTTNQQASISTKTPVVVKEDKQEIDFYYSMGQVNGLNAIDATFGFDTSIMTFKEATLMYQKNTMIKCKAEDGFVHIIAGSTNPLTFSSHTEVIKLTFTTNENDVDVQKAILSLIKVQSVESGADQLINPEITQNEAIVTIKTLRALCDINGDGHVDILDLSKAYSYYNKSISDDEWESAMSADVNFDQVIDLDDFSIITEGIMADK